MSTRYHAASVEAIQEDSEDESIDRLRAKDSDLTNERPYRYSRSSMGGVAAPTRANTVTEKERPRRNHRSKDGVSKHQSRSHGKSSSMKRITGPTTRENGYDRQRIRRRRTYSDGSVGSTSSSSDEDEPGLDHREVLAAARAKLTSPSMISTFTSRTNSTSKSSGSSGSNSTVTQASITKRSSVGKCLDMAEPPLSPAVPDPPNVFAFLDNGNASDSANEEGEEGGREMEEEDDKEGEQHDDHEERNEEKHESMWPPDESQSSYDANTLPPHPYPNHVIASNSSSTSSSLHGSDPFSEPAADVDTDRSTSPERSVKDHASDHEPEPTAPTDRASVRMASQMAAAQQRQNLCSSMQNYGTPNMPRGQGHTPLLHVASTALSPRHTQHVQQPSPPRAEKLPVTGYELLATRLSSYNSSSELEDGTVIKPMYRKFAALNHRLLLHLQDELSELEEQLHRLDNADTQSRRAGLGGRVVPASRRAAAMQGGELQWHKTDVLGRIGFKLAQYNQALASFNATQSLAPPALSDIAIYREYLSTEHPIAEVETRFLDPSDDLVSICSSVPPSFASSPPTSTPSASEPLSRSDSQVSAAASNCQSIFTSPREPQLLIQYVAGALALAVLVPILTFSVIPGFIGRITVVSLVACSIVFTLIQADIIGKSFFGREGLACMGIYGSVMIVIAGIMA